LTRKETFAIYPRQRHLLRKD